MKNVFVYRPSLLEMLDDNAFQQFRRHPRIPNALGIHDYDWSITADAEAWRLAALHTLRAKQQIFALQELRQQRVDVATATIGRAEFAGTDQHVTRVRLHSRISFAHPSKDTATPRVYPSPQLPCILTAIPARPCKSESLA